MYNFVFDRKSLTLLLGGLAFAGGLLFFAGVLVGVNWAVPHEVRVAALPPPPPLPQPVPEPAVEPVPAAAPSPEEEEEEIAAPEGLGDSDDLEAAPAEEPAAWTERESLTPPPAPKPEPPVAALAEDAAPATAPELGSYALQVGAFVREENSQEVVRDLASRGYQPYVEALTNTRGRLFHTVRIGRYTQREEALRAASEFRARERMAAIVQRQGTL